MIHFVPVAPQGGAAFFDVDKTLLPRVSTEALLVRALLAGKLPGRFRILPFLLESIRLLPQGLTVARKANKAYLAGARPEEVRAWGAEIFRVEVLPRLGARGRRWIGRERGRGRMIVLLTGMPDLLLEPFAAHFSADATIGTPLEVASDGRLTGRRAGVHPYGEAKLDLARSLAETHGWSAAQCSAYGDHKTDAILLAWAGEAFAVDPDPELRASARSRGWTILDGEEGGDREGDLAGESFPNDS
jgi:putative phosphoserine phosphatase/1-acylglycerol-3-phosphate O-acyltransferase